MHIQAQIANDSDAVSSSSSQHCKSSDRVKELKMEQVIDCPFADVNRTRKDIIEENSRCPFHQIAHNDQSSGPTGSRHEMQLIRNSNNNKNNSNNISRNNSNKESARLLREIGGGDRMREMTTRFYAHAFEDRELSRFIFDRDGAAAHGKRLGDWMVEAMGGEGDVWTDSGRGGMRQVRWVGEGRLKSVALSEYSRYRIF